MKVAIRTDASLQIGTGHVMRCLTLAQELRSKGAEVNFICRDVAGHMASEISKKGFSVNLLPAVKIQQSESGDVTLLHAEWLSVPWEQDAEETHKILDQQMHYDWLVVDHYALDERWEAIQRNCVTNIAVIDDLADRRHDCDLLLDQNLYENMDYRYQYLVPRTCKQLIGPKFALLREEFEVARKNLRKRDGSIHRLLVFFGGVDLHNMTSMALRAISKINLFSIEIDVVIGSGNPNQAEIKLLCGSLPNVFLHEQVDYMAKLMSSADLAIGAGGSTNWERLCLGLPAILVAVAFNQEKVLVDMSNRFLCKYLGTYKSVSVEVFQSVIEDLLEHPEDVKKMSDSSLGIMNYNDSSFSENIIRWNNVK